MTTFTHDVMGGGGALWLYVLHNSYKNNNDKKISGKRSRSCAGKL